jgi:two-component system sensor histidine kinase CreC
VTRLVIVAVAAIALILFVAFVVARLVESRTRGLSIRMQVFIALAVIVGAFSFGLGLMVIDRIEARAVRIANAAARDEATAIAGIIAGELERTGGTIEQVARRFEVEAGQGARLSLQLINPSSPRAATCKARSRSTRPSSSTVTRSARSVWSSRLSRSG